MTATAAPQAGPEQGPASLAYDVIPHAPRTWVVPGVYALGEVTVDAGAGEIGKGVRNAAFAARIVLGLPMPGEARELRHAPGRVLWLAAGSEDDPIHDLSGRFISALAACAAEYGLDPVTALAARRLIHDLSAWRDGSPVEVPQDLGKLRAEVTALNELDAANHGPDHPLYEGPGPAVRMVVMDPLDAILGPGATIDSRPGARRVMAALNLFARGAQVSVPVVHHVIASGRKIAGSPAVTNAVRLAFITAPDPANELVKVMSRFKSNASRPDDIRYVIAAGDPAPFAAFLGEQAATAGAAETLRDRVAAADDAPATLRDRVAAAAAGQAGAWRAMVRIQQPDGQPGPVTRLGDPHPTEREARQAATARAGQPLTWAPAQDHPGIALASCKDTATGRLAVYAVLASAGT